MRAFELDVTHKPPLVLGASLNPSSTVTKGAADPREAIHELLQLFRRTVEDYPRIDALNFNDAGFAPPDILDCVYSESTTADEPRFH